MSLKFPGNWLNNICNKFAMNPKTNVVVICMKLRLVTKQSKRHMKASKINFHWHNSNTFLFDFKDFSGFEVS